MCGNAFGRLFRVTAAIGALKGPLHGGANERVFDMLEEIDQAGDVRNYIQEKIDTKQKIMGFGHRVYRGGDPRANICVKCPEN